MAGLTDSLRILITANGAQAEREFGKVGASARRNLGQAETSAQRFGRKLTSAGVAMATFGAVALVGLGKAAQAAEEEHAALLRLENSIQNMPELAGASTAAFLDQAAALQDSTKFADDATVSAQAMLGTFHMTESQILRLTPLVQDYAAKFGVDLVTAAKQVGRAVAGSAGALQRNGIVLDENAYAADHFGTVMNALAENAGGFAEQEGQTLSGQLAILRNNFDDIIEAVGGGAASAFGSLLAPVSAASDALNNMNPATADFIGKAATFGAAALTMAGGLTFLGGQALQSATKIRDLASKIGLLAGGGGFAAVAGFALAAGAAVAMFSKSQEHARDVQNFADALKQEADGFEGATREALAHVLATDSAIKNYRNLGVSAEDIVGAIQGEGAAWDRLRQARSDAEAVFANQDLHDPAVQENAADVMRLVNAVDSQRGAYREANGAQEDFAAALSATGDAAGMTAEAIDALTQEIEDYLAGAFDVPSAQRDLRQSFDDLFETLAPGSSSVDDINEALQKTVEATAAVVSAQVEQNAGQDAVNATLAVSRQRLMDTYNAGLISQDQFIEYARVLDGIRPIVSTTVSTPGAQAAIDNLRTVRTVIDGIPRDIQVRVSVPNLGAIAADVQGAAAALRSLRPESISYSDTTLAADGGGRSRLTAVGAGGGGDIVVAPVILDGEKVGEVVARNNRRFNTGRGGGG